MIKFLIVTNLRGRVRVTRYYEQYTLVQQNQLQLAVVKLCLARSDTQSSIIDYEDYTVVFKKFSSIIFIAGITKDENELAVMEFFRHIGQTLFDYFGGLTELHFVYSLHKVYMILDEMLMNGYIAETSRERIIAPIQLMEAAKK